MSRGNVYRYSLLIVMLLIPIVTLHAQQQRETNSEVSIDPISFRGPDPKERFTEIYIEQKLGSQVPLDLEFRNESGEVVRLGDYFNDKPVILALVYFSCPSICNLILNGMVAGVDNNTMSINLGNDFEILTVSIDPREQPELAQAKKSNYLKQLRREGGENAWHFLTGEDDAIEDLAQAVGYRYYYDELTNQFAHASGIIILTPQGIVSSYYLGMEYLPQNLELALMDASDNRIGSLVRQLVLLCYAYDPAQGTYSFYIMRVVRFTGMSVVLGICLFWLITYLRKKPSIETVATSLPRTG